MILQPNTKTLLSEISTLSGNSLQCAMDLGSLLELSATNDQQSVLDDLAFSAKFITKSFDLMKRIGKEGNGYEKIADEFTAQLKTSQELLRRLLANADPVTIAHFTASYFEMNTQTLDRLMKLFHDLSWYKNYRIDHPVK